MATFINRENLTEKFGTSRAAATATGNQAGEYENDGPFHVVEAIIDLTTLASTATIIEDNFILPKNARIESIEVVAHTAATSGGSATLDIGLVSQTDRTTEIDFNGLVAALAKTAYDATGEKNTITVGGTGAGAILGTTNSTAGYLTANYNTAAFTAGVVRVRIWYYAV